MLPHPLLIEVDELLILGKAVCMCRIDKHERSGILAAGLHVYGKFCGCRRLGLDVFRRGSLHAVRAIRTAYPAVSAARGYHPQADGNSRRNNNDRQGNKDGKARSAALSVSL